MDYTFDFQKIEELFRKADDEDRRVLTEPEGYQLLDILGIQHPEYFIVSRGDTISQDLRERFRGKRVVVKVISPYIIHKTDFGGVRFCSGDDLDRIIPQLDRKVIDLFYHYVQQNPRKLPSRFAALSDADKLELITRSIKGYLIVPQIEFQKGQLGTEAIFGIKYTADFGPVISFGLGGVDAEMLSAVTYPGVAITIRALDRSSSSDSVADYSSFWIDKVLGRTRGGELLVEPTKIDEILSRFRQLGHLLSPFNQDSSYMIKELEINPLILHKGVFLALDVLVTFRQNRRIARIPAPKYKIDKMLKPKTIGLIGVSEKLNVGHVILNNILRNGFDPKQIYIIKQGGGDIEGCQLYPSLAALPTKIDLLVISIGAQGVWPVIQEAVSENSAESILLIPGGLGEKAGSEAIPERIQELLQQQRAAGKDCPVINGGNSLGIVSKPGHYDTLFIPDYKLLPSTAHPSPLVYISQSGAFMISRLSNMPALNVKYAISLGNQIDLTVSDFLEFAAEDPDIALAAVYLEGFQPLDGIRFKQIAERFRHEQKRIILYKAGRSRAGAEGVSGHTASIAGDYKVLTSILSSVGVIIVESFKEFENTVKMFTYLQPYPARGRKIGALSNAGFEAVGYADHVHDRTLSLATFQSDTVNRFQQIFSSANIDALVDVHNPLDITPMSNDSTFADCAHTLLEDDSVDIGLISFVPLTGELETLPSDSGHGEDFRSARSISSQLISLRQQSSKPFIVTVDSGRLYDPVVEHLERAGIPTFRSADEAIQTLKIYLDSYL